MNFTNIPYRMIDINNNQRRIGELTYEVQILQNQIQQLRRSIQQPSNNQNIIQDNDVLDNAVNNFINNPGCR
mgnify:FL=1|tara:strand:+ start:53 stop:268 length:216 start_codon:yes stop_codon:yes gene_type:complete